VKRERKRLVFGAIGAADVADAAQMVLGLIAVALFKLPEPIVLPSPHVVRVGLERTLIPDLRNPVVAELAVGIADQIGDVGAIILAERLQLRDRRGIVVAIVDRGIGCAITFQEFRIVDARALVAFLFLFLGGGFSRRRRGFVTSRL